jgi:hypothetical protein
MTFDRTQAAPSMTFDGFVKLADEKLREYEPLLRQKVMGTKPYNKSYSISLCRQVEEPVPNDSIKRIVCEVLDELLALDSGFWMSEPEIDRTVRIVLGGYEMQTVRNGNFNLTLTHGMAIASGKWHYTVSCSYVK